MEMVTLEGLGYGYLGGLGEISLSTIQSQIVAAMATMPVETLSKITTFVETGDPSGFIVLIKQVAAKNCPNVANSLTSQQITAVMQANLSTFLNGYDINAYVAKCVNQLCGSTSSTGGGTNTGTQTGTQAGSATTDWIKKNWWILALGGVALFMVIKK